MQWITDKNRTPDNGEWVNVAVRKSNRWITTTYGEYQEGTGWRLFDGFEQYEWNPKQEDVLGWHKMLDIADLNEPTTLAHSHIVNPDIIS